MSRTRFISTSIIVLTMAGLGLFWHAHNTPASTSASESATSGAPEAINALSPVTSTRSAAVGWSVADDPTVAVHEAVAKLRSRLGGKEPTFAIASFTVGYERAATVNALRSELGHSVKIHGLTSNAGLMTNDGWHVGKVGAVAVLGVAGDAVKVGTSGVEPDNFATLEEAGKAGILQAIADAGREPSEKPSLILITATNRGGLEQKLLDGIAEVVGNDVPVFGGDASDQLFDRKWTEFSHKDMYREGMIVTAVYTKRKVGWAFESGFRITDKTGIATKSNGLVVSEIDHRPALDVYNEWLNGELSAFVNRSGYYDIAAYTAQYPLCKVIHGPGGQIGYVTAHPVPRAENGVSRTLPVGALVEEGSRVQLFSGTWQTILNRAELAPKNALIRGDMTRENGMFGVLFSCAGAFHCIPESERPKLALLVGNVMGDVPFLGIITSGEQGFIPGVKSVNANLVQSMIAVGND